MKKITAPAEGEQNPEIAPGIGNLPWNDYSGWRSASKMSVHAGTNDDKSIFIEIICDGLDYFDIKPVKEEGFDWSVVHRSNDIVIWHRHRLT